jgi:nucleoside diphosphate kinase
MTRPADPTGLPLSPALSCDAAKRACYGADVYYLESTEQLVDLLAAREPGQHGTSLTDFAYEHALLLLKPDAVAARQVLPAIDWLRDNGFRIVAAERTRFTRTGIRALWHYQWNLATRYRRRLADHFLTAADSLVLVVRPESRPDVPSSILLTELKGPTNPDAREPGQLRHLLGRYCYLLNLVHTADEPADVLRELAVYFGTRERADVYAAALDGRDQRERAICLAGQLYAESPARELGFEPAAKRLAAAAELLLAGGLAEPLSGRLSAALAGCAAEPETWRSLVELAWASDLPFEPWDITTVGSYAFPMRRSGFSPVLAGPGLADWRRHLAAGQPDGASPAGPGDGPRVDFARTVARGLVHRRAVSEVFLTSADQVDAVTFDLGTQVPRQHGYFSDHLAHDAYDPMFFVEACRQGLFALAHSFLDAPRDSLFLLSSVRVRVTEPGLLTVGDAPAEARLRGDIERRYRDSTGRDAGFRIRYGAHLGGREALSCVIDTRWVSQQQWAAIRKAGRARLGLPAVPGPAPRVPRLDARAVGRRDQRNVMISPAQTCEPGLADNEGTGPAWSADLVIDPGHPTQFDHALDHIPGLLQLEAVRQLALAAQGTRATPPSPARLAEIGLRFTRFGELDLPVRCVATAADEDGDSFRCLVRQADATIAEGRIRLIPERGPRH